MYASEQKKRDQIKAERESVRLAAQAKRQAARRAAQVDRLKQLAKTRAAILAEAQARVQDATRRVARAQEQATLAVGQVKAAAAAHLQQTRLDMVVLGKAFHAATADLDAATARWSQAAPKSVEAQTAETERTAKQQEVNDLRQRMFAAKDKAAAETKQFVATQFSCEKLATSHANIASACSEVAVTNAKLTQARLNLAALEANDTPQALAKRDEAQHAALVVNQRQLDQNKAISFAQLQARVADAKQRVVQARKQVDQAMHEAKLAAAERLKHVKADLVAVGARFQKITAEQEAAVMRWASAPPKSVAAAAAARDRETTKAQQAALRTELLAARDHAEAARVQVATMVFTCEKLGNANARVAETCRAAVAAELELAKGEAALAARVP